MNETIDSLDPDDPDSVAFGSVGSADSPCCDGPCVILHPEGRLGFLRTPHAARWWPGSRRLRWHAQVEAYRDGTWIIALHIDLPALDWPSITLSGHGRDEITAQVVRL